MQAGEILHPGIHRLELYVDRNFPNSQPAIKAPEANIEYRWPHVETEGWLCLKATNFFKDPVQRLFQHILWAQEVLNSPEDLRRKEHQREFAAYWLHYAHDLKEKRPKILSLVAIVEQSKDLVYAYHESMIVVADSSEQLIAWFKSVGKELKQKQIYQTRLCWLLRPWTPSQYPKTGKDVINHLGPEAAKQIRPGLHHPVLFGAKTETGVVLVATILVGADIKDLQRGFRNIKQISTDHILSIYAARPVQRVHVERVDGSWVHGRDHNAQYAEIAGKTVAVVGCGSLGGYIAHFLARAGVGRLILVDGDIFEAHNASRHVLALPELHESKSRAIARTLHQQFPHMREVIAHPYKFEQLGKQALVALAEADVLVSAGITLQGDLAVDAWRHSLEVPPAHVATWLEEYALAGHAVGLFQGDHLASGFDLEESYRFRLTNWPAEAGATIVEAGCGTTFQPHDAIDMLPTVTLATNMVIDILIGKTQTAHRRVWFGDRDRVIQLGGQPTEHFTGSNRYETLPWA